MTSLNLNPCDTVLITGGTQGVGKGIALHLAHSPVNTIVICGRNKNKGNAVAQQIIDLGKNGHYVEADLSDVSGCISVAKYCEAQNLLVNAFVYAAGLSYRGTIETTSEETWDTLFNINLKGFFFLTQAILPLLRKSNVSNKSIVTICSFSSYCGRPELIAYNATKAALALTTKSLANFLKHERIRVNGINLGWTDTENERNIQQSLGNPPEWLDEVAANQPAGRLIKPEDVAHLVEFLLSEKSAMMTGSIIDFHQNVRV